MPTDAALSAGEALREPGQQRLLADLGAALIASLDLQRLLDEIARLLSNGALADCCAIDVTAEAGGLRLARVAHADPEKAGLTREIEARALDSDQPCFGRLAEGTSTLLAEVSASDLVSMAAGEAHLALLRALDPRSMLAVPLRAQGDLRGTLCLAACGQGRPYDAADLRFAEVIAARVAQALHNAWQLHAAERAVRMRDEVLGVVAHDLRNPLNIITMAANTLAQRLDDAPSQKSIARVLRSAQRANRLIQDLLDISAIEAGRFSVEKRPVEMADVVLAAIEAQQNLASAASIILASDVAPELPPIEADEERLLEVLENLMSNAIKFSGPGATITVGAGAGQGEVVVTVKDTGAGIPPEQLPHLFDRFWQARKKDRRGVGLGLTICKAIVEAHAGRIWAESRVGDGTTMSFTIPAASAPAPAAEDAGVANILLVDDRPENLLTLRAILERPDYRLVSAGSGEEALRCALRESFSVALIDVSMPVMDGLEVATHLKALERSRDIPIIFITAFGDDPQEIHKAYAAGGADYLVKPLDAEIVRKKVAVFVDLSRRRDRAGPARRGA